MGLVLLIIIWLITFVSTYFFIAKTWWLPVGASASAASIETAALNAGAGLEDVNADIHASAEYRRAMIQVFAERALKGALARVG